MHHRRGNPSNLPWISNALFPPIWITWWFDDPFHYSTPITRTTTHSLHDLHVIGHDVGVNDALTQTCRFLRHYVTNPKHGLPFMTPIFLPILQESWWITNPKKSKIHYEKGMMIETFTEPTSKTVVIKNVAHNAGRISHVFCKSMVSKFRNFPKKTPMKHGWQQCQHPKNLHPNVIFARKKKVHPNPIWL